MKRQVFLRANFLLGLMSTPFGASAYAFDAIKCQWELPTYRQLCDIEEAAKPFEFSASAPSEYLGFTMNLEDVIHRGKISLLTEVGPTSIDLTGISPYLELDTNLMNLSDCRLNPLWQHRIGILLNGLDGAKQYASDVPIGLKSHKINLDTRSYTIASTGEGLQFKGTFQFTDLDKGPAATVKRIPPQCKLEVINQKVGFDPVAINANLNTLKFTLNSLEKTVLKEMVLNGLYIKQQTGAVCSIEKLASTLYSLEGLAQEVSPESLSLTSQNAIQDAIQIAVGYEAIQKDLIPKNADNQPDYFAYYLKEETRANLRERCAEVVDSLKVKKDNFVKDSVIVNAPAYKNAQDYEMDIQNIHSIINGAWALVTFAKIDVQSSKELSWLIDPKIYAYANEK